MPVVGALKTFSPTSDRRLVEAKDPTDMIEHAIAVFLEEAEELLTDLEKSLLELEESPEDMDVVAKVFRSMHTIKGSAAMFGYDAVSSFTHHVETVFDQVRNGEIPVTQELVNLSLAARDHIRGLLEDPTVHPVRGNELLTDLKKLPGPYPLRGNPTTTAMMNIRPRRAQDAIGSL